MSRLIGALCAIPLLALSLGVGPLNGSVALAKKADAEPRRCALLVGINTYGAKHTPAVARGDQWGALSGTGNDVTMLGEVLRERFGFQVKVLRDKAATGEGIERAFKAHLIDCVQGPEDAAFFHFSGHGQQITDQDGDELDGLDESLVPHDNAGQAKGERNIRDDEFDRWMTALTTKTDNVLVSFDSCHSGTATRGDNEMVARGGRKQKAAKTAKSAPDNSGPGGWTTRSTGPLPYAFMAAADSDQSAYEYPMPGCDPTEGPCKVSRFSFHLARALAEVDPDVSYAELLSNVRAQLMAASGSRPNQHPQLHGQSHRPLFGTGYVKRPVMSFAVQPVRDIDKPVKIAAGVIHGLKRDQTVALYATDADAVAGEEPLGHVFIDRLKASSAVGYFVEDEDPDEGVFDIPLRAVPSYDHGQVIRLKVDATVTGLDKALQGKRFVEVVDKGAKDWTVRLSKKGRNLVLRGPDGQTIGVPSSDASGVMGESISSKVKSPSACVVASLESHFKRTRLLAIRNQHPGRRLDVTMRLYRSGPGPEAKRVPLQPGINDVFAPGGDKLWVEVVNRERRRISLSILEVGPGGRVGDVFDGADVSIEASDGKVPKVWAAGSALTPPEGRYTLKLIATPERTDFSPLAFKVGDRCDLRRDGVTTRGSCKGLTCLFDALSPRTRGNLTTSSPKWTTVTAEFTVKR